MKINKLICNTLKYNISNYAEFEEYNLDQGYSKKLLMLIGGNKVKRVLMA